VTYDSVNSCLSVPATLVANVYGFPSGPSSRQQRRQLSPSAFAADIPIPTVLPWLQLSSGSGFKPFPGWASFLAQLGGTVGLDVGSASRLVVAVGVPTRIFAAPLIAAGIVAARLSLGSRIDKHSHFDSLSSHPPGTPMLLEIGGRRFDGIFEGTTVLRGERWARVTILRKRGSAETHFVPESESLRIGLPSPDTSGSGYRVGRARTLVRRRGFLRAAFGPEALTSISRESRLECVLLGRRSTLAHEVYELLLATPPSTASERMYHARLSDLLRARTLLAEGQPYRSDIVSSLGRRSMAEARLQVPHVVVFDGAPSFIKWRHLWTRSHWIVVLDQTEPRCIEGAAAVDALYADRAVGGPLVLQLPDCRGHMDVAAFRLPLSTPEAVAK
jgi:hypothetical protein